MIVRFFSQPVKAHRNLHIVCGLLGLQFFVASLAYLFAPTAVAAQINSMTSLFGVAPYHLSSGAIVWRVLAFSDVFTLAVLCFMIQANVRRFRALIPVFAVLKGTSSLGFLGVFVFVTHVDHHPIFFIIFAWDAFNLLLVVVFGHKALRALEDASPDVLATLVPPLAGSAT